MLMPMLWTNVLDDDDLYDPMDTWYDPFDDMISLVPSREDIQNAKSIARHERKEGKREGRQLRHELGQMDRMVRGMKTDVIDNGDHYTLKADLPGFDKKDIKVDLKDGVLTVSAKHTTGDQNDKKDENSENYVRHERTECSYERAFEVGEDVKPQDITAKYENGVLTLNVPKKKDEDKGTSRIAIE